MTPFPTVDQVVLEGLSRGLPALQSDDLVAPFAEGAKARHIVDLCAALGLPAVFLDGTGRVFHMGALAGGMMRPTVAVRSGHLIAANPGANDRVQDTVSKALCAMGGQATRRTVSIRESGRQPLHLIAIDYPSQSPAQLLKVVVVVTRDPLGTRADVATLTRHLNNG